MGQTIVRLTGVNLEEYPFTSDADATVTIGRQNSLTVGDLHGNALKLIWVLIKQNALKLNPVDNRTPKELYERLVAIYKTPVERLSKEDLQEFNRIIDAASINRFAMLRLIGDELADRGENDYFTLKMLKRLGDSGVRTEILLSNHSAEFLDNYHKGTLENPRDLLGDVTAKSMYNLGKLIERGLVSSQEVTTIVKDYYLPSLKAISYSVDNTANPPKLTLYTHAPVGIETIKSLASLYDITYDDSSMTSLCQVIDNVNEKVHQDLSQNSVHARHQDFLDNSLGLGGIPIPRQHPLLRLMWNRGDEDMRRQKQNKEQYGIELPLQQNGYQLALVHGHDGPSKKIFRAEFTSEEQSYFPHMFNTDNDLGKGNLAGDFHMVVSDDVPAPLPPQQLPIQMHAILYRIGEGAKNNVPNLTDRGWHQRFVAYEMEKLVSIDRKNNNSLSNPEGMLTNWMSIYKVPRNKNENMTDYSIRVAQNNTLYASKFEEFKNNTIRDAKSMLTVENQALARSALNDIKQFIETSNWQVGRLSSRTKIEINGEVKPIPNHLYAIYKKCIQAENGKNPTQLLQEIHNLAAKALEPKFKLFEKYRERYQSTRDVYAVIERDTGNLLKPN